MFFESQLTAILRRLLARHSLNGTTLVHPHAKTIIYQFNLVRFEATDRQILIGRFRTH
jgi:hypothetical protein